MNKLIQNFNYRPEIDGLRAVAVLAVVLYHAGLGIGGGFIGVDVFFVISGYLITSLILKDLEAGRFSMLAFWERRARRIIPAAVVLVVAVLFVGWFLLLPTDYTKLGASSLAHAAFSANLYFWQTTSYFAGPAEEVPLLHTWSLAVEEQFYFFIPVLLLLLFKLKAHKRAFLIFVFAALTVSSLVLSIWAVPRMPAAAFYLLPTRAWELALGSIAALIPLSSLVAVRSGIRSTLAWSGLVLILLPCLLYSSSTPFPGLAAFPPCLGATLFIVFSNSAVSGADSKGLLVRMFSSKPMVGIGLVSYSLYLWHWPLFAFSNYWSLSELSLGRSLSLVVLSGFLAYLSWRFVETPFRLKNVGATRRGIYAYSFAGLTLTALVGFSIARFAGLPERYSSEIVAIDFTRVDEKKNHLVPMMSPKNADQEQFPFFIGDETSQKKVFVWGDSHSRVVLPALSKAFEGQDVSVQVAWYPSTPPLLEYVPTARFALDDQAPAYNGAIMNYLERHEFDHIVLVGKWSEHLPDAAVNSEEEAIAASLLRTVERIIASGATPWIFLQIPQQTTNIPKVLIAQRLFDTDISPYLLGLEQQQRQNARLLHYRDSFERAGAVIVDPAPLLIDREGHFMMGQGDQAFYFDNNHLSVAGAEFIAPVFQPLAQTLGATRE